ncbi:MAG TPA: protein kinase [Candidatus Saccharimonadales bacterium]|nr:protein kinase [Candidatus Saccharimonadales bacterium]
MLAAGTSLGPYRILAPLGAGGMGEVYRAHDARLGRDVAIKVLPPHLAATPETRARFEREARTISQLSHPHICTLFDVGREGDTDYLVMELLEGETLAHRLERGPLPVAEVLRLGGQVAEALDQAHRAGVVHRDLKPGNVMLTKSGAKLMDFGLARAAGLAPVAGGLTESPTVSRPLTAAGTIVGTFQYMAPEQLEGKEADARADIWALGCVLYEMTTGQRAFEGASQASLISAIMKDEPRPLAELQPLSPATLEHVVRVCLAKDPDQRWQAAADLARELRWVGESASQGGAVAAAATPRRQAAPLAWLPWAAAAALAVVTALALTTGLFRQGAPKLPRLTLEIALPHGLRLMEVPAISPDGEWLVFAATDSTGTTRLWLRGMGGDEVRPLPGTEGDNTLMPFWSPDSRNIGFFSGGKLRRIPLEGGSPLAICDVQDSRGGSWGADDVILFAPDSKTGIFRVSASGGVPAAVTHADLSPGNTSHRFPWFLPDGRHFLYWREPTSQARPNEAGIWWASLDGAVQRRVCDATSAAAYADPGQLLYRYENALLARPFDPRSGRATGAPRAVIPARPIEPFQKLGSPTFSVSNRGVLTCEVGWTGRDRLYWYGRSGRPLGPASGLLPMCALVDVSPDARRALYVLDDPGGGGFRVWLVDLRSGLGTILTHGVTGWNGAAWSPDGREVYFQASTPGREEIHALTLEGSAAERTVYVPATSPNAALDGCTPDGKHLLVEGQGASGRGEMLLVPISGSGRPQRLVSGAFSTGGVGDVSPDGRLLAYATDETGRFELYITSFPVPRAPCRVSTEGCQNGFGRWTRGGREIVFVSPDNRVMAAEVPAGAEIQVRPPQELFRLPPDAHNISWTREGDRFLLALPGEPQPPQHLAVLLNWQRAEAK